MKCSLLTRFGPLLLTVLLSASATSARCQLFGVDTTRYQDSVRVGDTAVVAAYSVHVSSSGCDCSLAYAMVSPLYGFFVSAEHGMTANIGFSPIVPGRVRDTLLLAGMCTGIDGIHPCSSPPSYRVGVLAVGGSDSNIAIRPIQWGLVMHHDSTANTYLAVSTPTFDNNISDTTTFDLTASSNGSPIQLALYDSSRLITSFRAMPFQRKHPLTILISSTSYRRFDSVMLAIRIRHHDVDSIATITLPVQWDPIEGIRQSNFDGYVSPSPNPFKSVTKIGVKLMHSEMIKIELFDAIGQMVQSRQYFGMEGVNEISVDGGYLPIGSYWYVLSGGGWIKTGSILHLN